MPIVIPLLIGGGLIVGGVVATGFLVGAVATVLHEAGKFATFDTTEDVTRALLESGRPDLAQEVVIAQATGNTSAFNAPTAAQPQSIIGEVGDILPLAIAGFVLLKVLK